MGQYSEQRRKPWGCPGSVCIDQVLVQGWENNAAEEDFATQIHQVKLEGLRTFLQLPTRHTLGEIGPWANNLGLVVVVDSLKSNVGGCVHT